MSFTWTYDTMYKWYKKQESQTDDLVVISYDWMKVSKKMEYLEPFIKKNITHIQSFCENSYIVLDDNKSHRKWLYIVTPVEKMYEHRRITMADHYTFCLEPTDTKNPVHFHSTTYVTEPALFYAHVRDYFPEKISSFPKQGYDGVTPIVKPMHQKAKPLLIDVMRAPWTVGMIVGGGRKGRKNAVPPREVISPSFVSACTRIRMKHLNAFGFRKGGRIHWSCNIILQGRQYDSVLKPAFYFVLPEQASEKEFQDTLTNLILETLQ